MSINPRRPDILFICLGNICRSPLAEGITRALINQRNLDLTVASAGTGKWHIGEPPHKGSQCVALAHHIDISLQRARHISSFDLPNIPWLLVMDEQNRSDVIDFSKGCLSPQQIQLLRVFEEGPSGQAPPIGVPDPYYGNGKQAFDEVYSIIQRSCENLLTAIMSHR